jgi:pyridoxine 4-dehydrogenase
VAITRFGPGVCLGFCPEYLIKQAVTGFARLGLKRHDLWQLHHVNPAIPYDEQLRAVRSLKDEGITHYAGLIEPTVAQIEQARTFFPVAENIDAVNIRLSEDEFATLDRVRKQMEPDLTEWLTQQ